MNDVEACQHVIDLERCLLDPAVRADAAAIDAILHADFVEHGTSGRVWTRQEIVNELPLESEATPQVVGDHFEPVVVAPGVILLTYLSTSTQRTCNRSSLWIEVAPDDWKMRFHQGTQTTDR